MNKEQKDIQSIVDQIIVDTHRFTGPRFRVSRSLWWRPQSRLRRAGRIAKRRAKIRDEVRRQVTS